ncbi:MAG: hypothetical protein IAE79_25205, partial [Anaerolinea sp.]|nr:hypothetical protein [Anaerolinea sp.]
MDSSVVKRIQLYLQTQYSDHDVLVGSPFTIFLHQHDTRAAASTAVPNSSTHANWLT